MQNATQFKKTLESSLKEENFPNFYPTPTITHTEINDIIEGFGENIVIASFGLSDNTNSGSFRVVGSSSFSFVESTLSFTGYIDYQISNKATLTIAYDLSAEEAFIYGKDSIFKQVTVNFIDVDEPLMFTNKNPQLLTLESNTPQSVFIKDMASDADSPTISYSASGYDNSLIDVTIQENTTLTISPKPNQSGETELTLTAKSITNQQASTLIEVTVAADIPPTLSIEQITINQQNYAKEDVTARLGDDIFVTIKVSDVDGSTEPDQIIATFNPAKSATAIATSTSNKYEIVPFNDGEISVAFQVQNALSSDIAKSQFNLQVTAVADEYYQHQWHLKNTGQNFSSYLTNLFSATSGNDLNLPDDQSINGLGVIVSVIDDGLDINHLDIAQNYLQGSAYNQGNKLDTPEPINDDDAHGTAVAGIIAARGFNGQGIHGIANRAKIIAHNIAIKNRNGLNYGSNYFLEATDQSDIVNMSFSAISLGSIGLDSLTSDSIDKQLQSSGGRRGTTGPVFVKAAGNDYSSTKLCNGYAPYRSIYSDGTNNLKPTSCSLTSADYTKSNRNVITVAALNAQDKKSSYSTVGPGLWISGYAGDYSSVNQTITTTDLTGCSKGYTKSKNYSLFFR